MIKRLFKLKKNPYIESFESYLVYYIKGCLYKKFLILWVANIENSL